MKAVENIGYSQVVLPLVIMVDSSVPKKVKKKIAKRMFSLMYDVNGKKV